MAVLGIGRTALFPDPLDRLGQLDQQGSQELLDVTELMDMTAIPDQQDRLGQLDQQVTQARQEPMVLTAPQEQQDRLATQVERERQEQLGQRV